MQVGDTSKEWVRSDAVSDRGRHVYGTVVYIHPLRRFYVVEFDFNGRKYRESFPFQYRKGEK